MHDATDAVPMIAPGNKTSIIHQTERPAPLNKEDLYELCELISTIWLGGYMPTPEV